VAVIVEGSETNSELHQAIVNAYSEKTSETPSEADSARGERVKVLRKYINTRLSKIKRGEGNSETHKKNIKKNLRTLAAISKEDFQQMVHKFESVL
jgi:hypothetical protein